MAQKTDAWLEQACVTITEVGGTDYNYQTLTETVDIDLGDRDIEGIATLAGGRIVRFIPEGDTSITLECYSIEAATPDDALKTAAGRGFLGHFWDGPSSDPQTVTATRTRLKHRLVVLWTDNTTDTDAPGAMDDITAQGIRFMAADGYVTSVKPSFTDGILKFTVTLKFPPYQADGTPLLQWQSTESANTIAMLQSYTSLTRW